MEEDRRVRLEREFSAVDIPDSKFSLLEQELSKFDLEDKFAESILSLGYTLDKKDRKKFYENTINMVGKYEYPSTINYIMDKLLENNDQSTLEKIDLFGKGYVSLYINFLDLDYRRSKGIELVEDILSSGDLNEEKVKYLLKKDIENRDLTNLVPKEVQSNLY